MTERYAGQIDAQQIESTTALVERINAQLPQQVKLCLIGEEESGIDTAMLMVVDFDEDGEETGDWGWYVDLPAADTDNKYVFIYAGNCAHEDEGRCANDDASLIAKITSLHF